MPTDRGTVGSDSRNCFDVWDTAHLVAYDQLLQPPSICLHCRLSELARVGVVTFCSDLSSSTV